MTPKERPILFSGAMVQAILEGRKTQTRRVIKPQPYKDVVSLRQVSPSGVEAQPSEWISWTERGDISQHVNFSWHSPYGQPGDRLWVRETHTYADVGYDSVAQTDNVEVHYKSDNRAVTHDVSGDVAEQISAWIGDREVDGDGDNWRPSIHMPRWASRITLEVVRVGVERVQEISEADAMAEGCDWHVHVPGGNRDPRDYMLRPGAWRDGFRTLWDSINAKRGFGWDSNPWVWVVEFKVVQP